MGPNGPQDGIYNVDHKEHSVQKARYSNGEQGRTKAKVVPVKIKVPSIEPIKIKMAPIKEVGEQSKEQGDGKNSQNNGVQQHTDLKVQHLFAIVVHKSVLLFVDGPK